ncbi:MAG TPA: class I SAM-dependent methyltransferase [Acidimicrobiales bacterium]
MRAKLDRVRAAAKEAMLHGQNSWSIQYLTAKDSRFSKVWEAAGPIPGWFGQANAVAQFLVLAEVKPKRIVEIGSFLGKSTVFYAKSLEVLGLDGRVTAIDPHTGDRQNLEALGISELPSFDMFRSHLMASGVFDSVDTRVATSHDASEGWTEPIDFLFIDGWHSYDAVMEDGHDWIPHLTDGGVVVFDDALRYRDVKRAIDDLVTDGTVHLYGDAFGQAFGGRRAETPASVATVLGSYRPLTRHLPGHRLHR